MKSGQVFGLRKLIKEPSYFESNNERIIITPLVERLLFLCDNVAFVENIQIPNQNKWVLMDRCNFISDIPYGLAAGVSIRAIKRLHSCIIDPPKIDFLFILQCPYDVLKSRKENRKSGEKCRIEDKGDVFFKKVSKIYNGLIFKYGSYLKRFVKCNDAGEICAEYVDSTRSPEEIVNIIIDRGRLLNFPQK